MPYTELPNSSFLDFTSWRSGASAPTGGPIVTSFTLNVALILDRTNDPSTLLNANWASRQQQLDTLNDNGTLWSTYGADTAKYNQVKAELAGLGIKTVEQVAAEQGVQSGYVSSAESRTIWVQVDPTNIDKLFGPGFALRGDGSNWHWEGNLSLPDGWASTLGVKGLWFDTTNFNSLVPNPGNGTLVPLPQGWQSPGNASTSPTNIFPQQIADQYYNFPFSGDLWNPASGIAPQTGTIGLVESGVGAAVPNGSFGALLNHYRALAGINTPAQWTSVAPGGELYPIVQPPAFNPAGERSLDVGVVTAINPQSPMVLYAGSGYSPGAQSSNFGPQSSTFTAYQSSFWDLYVATDAGLALLFCRARTLRRCRAAQHHGVQRRGRRRLGQPERQWPDQCRHQPGQPLCLHGGRHGLQHRPIGAGRRDPDRRRLAGDGSRSRDHLAAHGRRPDGDAQSIQPRRPPDRSSVERVLRDRHDHRVEEQSDRLSAQQHGLGRRRSQPARALVPDGVRPRSQDVGSFGSARAWRTGRRG
jgi:hypothetical protein